MHTASLVVYVYAALVMLGGVIGYLKARSLPSILGGDIGAVLLAVSAWGMGRGQAWGLPLALVLILGLLVFFALRFVRLRAFMPGGLMTILSLLALAGVLLTRGR